MVMVVHRYRARMALVDLLRRAVIRRLHAVGWELHRHPSYDDFAHRRSVLMRDRGIDLVADVGANIGQYAMQLREYGYHGRIVSFEPLAAAHERLARSAARDPLWTAWRVAAGDHDGELEINVANNLDSSSALPMLDRHLVAAPHSMYSGVERVPLRRLDGVLESHLSGARSPYLKIDTQGFEARVLEGARSVLDRFQAVELELSLVPLYDGQPLWLELIEFLQSRGFRAVGLAHGFWDERTGETLQVDGVFVRDTSL